MKIPELISGSRKSGLIRLCAIGLAQASLAAGSVFIVRHIIDELVAGSVANWTYREVMAPAALVGLVLLTAWLRRCERIEAESRGQSYVHAVRLKLYDRLSSLTPRNLQDGGRGPHLLRFIGDLTAFRQWVSLGLARLSVAAIIGVVSLAALAVINVPLAITVGAVLAASVVGAFAMGSRLQDAVRLTRRCRARLAGDISERIYLMPVVQIFSQVRRERGRVRRRSRTLRNAMIERARIVGFLRALTEATTGIATAGVLAVGSYEIAQGRATLGAVVGAMSILAILAPAFRDLSRVFEYWHSYVVARNRIREFLSQRPSVRVLSSAPELPDGPGEVTFKDIAFGDVLKNISVTAVPGQTVAIIGPNGAGKSTLLSLVARLIEPSSGEVLIDNNNLLRHSAASVRSAIGMVGPDLPLMRGTIRRNICYRFPKVSEADLRHVCTVCKLDETLDAIPGGLDARVVEGGLNLSPGQRQRIALARAILGLPRLLILDEFDANLDPKSSHLIKHVLKSYEGTVLFVSHRIEQIAHADVIWHVEDGTLIEVGAPVDLLHRDGPTRTLLRRPLVHAA